MKFGYQLLSPYSEKLRRAICASVAVTFYALICFIYLSISSSSLKDGVHLEASRASRDLFVVWTYSEPPPLDSIISEDEQLVCSYSSVCAALDREGTKLNLLDVSSAAPSKFQNFVLDHAFLKVMHGKNFPHHVQAVSVLSMIAANKKSCVKTLGKDDSDYICAEDLIRYEGYDPNTANSPPPFELVASGLYFESSPYTVLDYGKRTVVQGLSDVEDALQSLAVIQYVPYVSEFVDRDTGLLSARGHLIASGSWLKSDDWIPPSLDETQTILVSVNVEGDTIGLSEKTRSYLLDYNHRIGAIGAKDETTLRMLQMNNIQAYLSSSFTSMLKMNESNDPSHFRRNHFLSVDVDPSFLPSSIRKRVTHLSTLADPGLHREGLFRHTHALLQKYARAKVVITSKEETAIIAMAQGVPVIFVESSSSDHVSNLVHHFNPINDTWTYDLDHMLPNPGVHQLDRYRASFLHYLKVQHTPYIDTAELFGIVPFTRLGKDIPASDIPLHDIFHMIFTTPPETVTWRIIRAVEAVFYHHPNAKLIMHSRTLPQVGSPFDIFVEAGYDFVIQFYEFEELLKDSEVLSDEETEQFLGVLEERRTAQFWYSHETDLIRMLIMDELGGVYLDTDQHIVQAFPKALTNVLGWQDDGNMVNGALMMFEKGGNFIREALKNSVDIAIHSYNPDNWGVFGPNMLTQVYHDFGPNSLDIKILPKEAFQPYLYWMSHLCFEADKTKLNPIHPSDTYSVHLNTKMTQAYNTTDPGTVCEDIFNSNCIFCDEIHVTQER